MDREELRSERYPSKSSGEPSSQVPDTADESVVQPSVGQYEESRREGNTEDHSVGAPHIRQRQYFVADTRSIESRWISGSQRKEIPATRCHSEAGILADTNVQQTDTTDGRGFPSEPSCGGVLGNTLDPGLEGHRGLVGFNDSEGRKREERHSPTSGFWGNADWVYCRDEKYRPVEPGTSPLAARTTNRVGKLRGYGNAVCAEVAKEFVAAYMETRTE